MRTIAKEILDWLTALIFSLPGKLGQWLRTFWGRGFFRRFQAGSRIGRGVVILNPIAIDIAKNVHIGQSCFLSAEGGQIFIADNVKINERAHINASVGGDIRIGSDCLIGPNVVMRTASHVFDDPDQKITAQGHAVGSITIEEDVWIAANAVILPDVTIGRGAVIAAGAVVTKSVAPLSVVGGVPAKVMSVRGSKK